MEALNTDAFTELAREVSATFGTFRGEIGIKEVSTRSWASVTFTGARHRLRLTLSGDGAPDAANRFLKNLGEAEFSLRGHIVADIALLAEERSDCGSVVLELEALTVEDC